MVFLISRMDRNFKSQLSTGASGMPFFSCTSKGSLTISVRRTGGEFLLFHRRIRGLALETLRVDFKIEELWVHENIVGKLKCRNMKNICVFNEM